MSSSAGAISGFILSSNDGVSVLAMSHGWWRIASHTPSLYLLMALAYVADQCLHQPTQPLERDRLQVKIRRTVIFHHWSQMYLVQVQFHPVDEIGAKPGIVSNKLAAISKERLILPSVKGSVASFIGRTFESDGSSSIVLSRDIGGDYHRQLFLSERSVALRLPPVL
ncbi:hypothetical protein O9992_21715 [Vibrio lentus]|nr:hypothetical protein [Vibrio lentus]